MEKTSGAGTMTLSARTFAFQDDIEFHVFEVFSVRIALLDRHHQRRLEYFVLFVQWIVRKKQLRYQGLVAWRTDFEVDVRRTKPGSIVDGVANRMDRFKFVRTGFRGDNPRAVPLASGG